MKDFKIGDSVLIKATIWMAYKDENVRVPYRNKLDKPIGGKVIGLVRRQLGTYHPGHNAPYMDFEPGYLDITGTILLWKVTTGWLNNHIEVQDSDIKLLGTNLPLPMLGRRPGLQSDLKEVKQ